MSSIQAQIVDAADSYGIDPSLALAVAQQESGFNQAAIGTSGEVGVFQLMPTTAANLGVDPTDQAQNIDGGVRLLSQLLAQYNGDTAKALAAYNAGPGAVASGHIPSSTTSYVSNVMNIAGYNDPATSGFPWLAMAVGIAGLVFVMGD